MNEPQPFCHRACPTAAPQASAILPFLENGALLPRSGSVNVYRDDVADHRSLPGAAQQPVAADILEANDPALLAAALGDIARARGMSEIAKASRLTREALYQALRPGAQRRFDTISRVCAALGVRLVAQAVQA